MIRSHIPYFFLSLILLSSLSCQQKEPDPVQRPNILFIMSDDHTSQAISAYGGILSEVCPTPNIDRIANEGMLFENCFVTNSICTPSRAAIFTGQYAHKNGVYKFTALDQSQPTLPKSLQEGGYQTAIIGKYHLISNPVGMDYFSVLPGQGRYHNPAFIRSGDEHPSGWIPRGKRTVFEGMHSSDAIADQALDYLKRKRKPDQPFTLFCHFKAPHDTWEYAERYASFLEDVEIPEPPTLFDDYQNRSDALSNTLQYIGSDWGNHTNFREQTAHLHGEAKKKMQYQLYMKKYLRCVKGVDDNVGRILDYLDEAGLADNTIVVYTGDQGFFLGEHGLYDKRFMYEEAFRMPFLLRWPEKVKAGSRSSGMITNVDFAPTLMEVAGVDIPQQVQGRSFQFLLGEEIPSDWRKSMYYRYYYSHFETEPHYGVRTYQYKLIYFDRIDQWELFDLEKDPLEINSVYKEPAYQDIVKELKAELLRLQEELGDDPADDGSKPRLGKLAPKPLYVAKDAIQGPSDQTILMQFQTTVGGTLLSFCDLEADAHAENFPWDRIKTLYTDAGKLFYCDGYDDENCVVLDLNLSDGKPHTLAFRIQDKLPAIFLDGQQQWAGKQPIQPFVQGMDLNIGAGFDDGGWMGYNFQGEIAQVLRFEEALEDAQIATYAKGTTPSVEAALIWPEMY